MPKAKNPVRKRRLRNLNDCCRAAAWLFNSVARDEIEPSKAGRLGYILNIQKGILQAIEQLEIERKQITDFEERLSKIETKLKVQS
jgi:hypothetical protein